MSIVILGSFAMHPVAFFSSKHTSAECVALGKLTVELGAKIPDPESRIRRTECMTKLALVLSRMGTRCLQPHEVVNGSDSLGEVEIRPTVVGNHVIEPVDESGLYVTTGASR
jgi:hypothetical protein